MNNQDIQNENNQDVQDAQLSFKEASIKLESIVRSLEKGDMELEQSLLAYKEGVELVKDLQKRLEAAEQEVQTLTEDLFPEEETKE